MKKVYFFDNVYFMENKSMYESLLKPMQELSEHYSGLGLIKPFTKELLLQSINNLPELIKTINSELLKVLETAEIPTILIIAVEKEIKDKLSQLEEKAKAIYQTYLINRRFSQYSLHLDYDYFEVSETGVVTYSEQRLREHCTVFVENATQEKAISLIDAINAKTKQLYKVLSNQLAGIPKDNKAILNAYTHGNNGLIQLDATIVERLK